MPIPESVEGRSFLPLAQGQNPEWRDYIHGEHGSTQWITNGHEKYIWYTQTGTEQLFDLDRKSVV